jgi:hypothetical protein
MRRWPALPSPSIPRKKKAGLPAPAQQPALGQLKQSVAAQADDAEQDKAGEDVGRMKGAACQQDGGAQPSFFPP